MIRNPLFRFFNSRMPLRNSSVVSLCLFAFTFFALLTPLSLMSLAYRASIEGVNNAAIHKQLKASSQLVSYQAKGVTSMKQLKNLIDTDKENMRKVAIYNGFFSCSIHPVIVQTNDTNILFRVELGPRYSLRKVDISWTDKKKVFEKCPIDLRATLTEHEPLPHDIPSFTSGKPAEGDLILSFEYELIETLKSRGFFFASIVDKKFVAFPHSAFVDVHFDVETGPLVRFGDTTIEGASDIKESFIKSKIKWETGEFLSQEKIEQTETKLLKTGLFQSVIIDCKAPKNAQTLLATGDALPVTVSVAESKQKTVGAGISYTTTLGGGTSLEWEHRNIRGVGQRLSFRAELWQKMRAVTLTYAIPQWNKQEKTTFFILEHDHQTYLPYHSSAIKASILREQLLFNSYNFPRSKYQIECVWGGRIERLESTRLLSNRLYHLLKAPIQLKWSNANSQFDPTSGMTFNVKLTPSYQFLRPHFGYVISQFTWSGYDSFADNTKTLATRFSCGSIVGAGKNSIPVPDRFFGGTENSLRGYKTGSVAPTNNKNEPLGGRSILTGTLELRTRYKTGFGSVVFYDVGNVFHDPLPNLDIRGLYHAVGGGVRYKTPIGPLRLDIAFPLNRRKGIDPPFQIYFSIGQAF